ncbi:diguanylate cyclase domain-containing protein [Parazoarcus communis]|uniref:PAS domain S-box protein n=2 Tax=Parazoarcus communis TaxID=41977 RepID=A0A323UWY8_9RHOO|nr:diguanylate cyclase [Parazoarcus communis]NMG72753.1 diguanylate cyclase [Parazoarcus communis SWub3 = DSM 12120]PZA16140.1 PAS domain S-box protein [Azoarcus communis] [Parazoarcus communis SWub3 = DSM 12120]
MWFHLALTLVAAVLVLFAPSARALDKVVLQLKWTHAFQFAGYYAAVEKGFYREVGLEVELREAVPGLDPVEEVLSGRAAYGVGNSSLLLARSAGKPVVALAVVFQHSPVVIMAREYEATQGVHNLIGKRLMVEPQSDELLAYLDQAGVPLDRVEQLPHSFNPQDLIEGKVDAITAYVTNEPFFLEQAGVPFHLYTPRSVGIDFYGDNLFTTEQVLKQGPERVRAMREASLRGWRYAMAHPEEVIDLIMAKYSQRHPRAFYQFEARQMVPLLMPELIEIGYMNPGRWRHIADTYADLGLMPRDVSLDGFLYEPDLKADLKGLYAALVLLLGVSAIAFYIHRVNRRLALALMESHEAHEALSRSEERHRLLADHASDVIWTMDLQGRFTYVSPSVEKLRGYTVDEVMRQSLDEALTPESAPIAVDGLSRAIAAVQAGLPVPDFRAELEQPCKDGSTVWTEVTVTGIRNESGVFVGLLGVTRNISERKQAEAKMLHMARHDPLTGLPNRALLADRLQQAMAAARRDGQVLALMFIDLDKFKPINDSLGHAVGDVLLVEVARRVRNCVRESDTVARIGGDEFVVLLRAVDSESGALAVADKIRVALGQPVCVGEHRLGVSASIGVAMFPAHGEDDLALTQHADIAMYEAKARGGDAVYVFRAGEAGVA